MTEKEIVKSIVVNNQRRFPNEKIVEREVVLPEMSKKIVIVPGVRRCGKSSLLELTINRLIVNGLPKDMILYFNFDDERLKFNSENLYLIIEAYRELYPDNNFANVYIFFDEIQMADNWDGFVRRIYEQECQNVFLTGSNSRLLSSEFATALRGRSIQYEEFPLSFGEMCRFCNVATNYYDDVQRAKIVRLFDQYLAWGAFPEVVTAPDDIKQRILNEYFYVMMYKDLVERYKISPTDIARYYIKRVLENVTKPTSIHKIFNELKSQGLNVGKERVYSLAEQVEAIYMLLPLLRYSISINKSSSFDKKYYCIDPGLRAVVLKPHSDDNGKMLENVVFLHLRRKLQLGKQIFYYKGVQECDFLLENRGEVEQLIQVSWDVSDENTLQREIGGLVEAAKATKCNNLLIITHDDDRVLNFEDFSITIIPAWKWMLL